MMSKPEIQTTRPDCRLDAVIAVINNWHGERTVDDLAREVLAAADAVDPFRTMAPLLRRLNAQRKQL